MKKVGVVIVTFNNAQMLEGLLQSLLQQTVNPAEIFVVDNSYSDNSEDLVKNRFPQVEYVRFKSNLGSAGGYYEGIKRASQSNELVWLLDDDIHLQNDSLANLLAGLQDIDKYERVGAVRSWCGARCPFAEPKKINTFAWRGTLITKEAIQEIGLPKPEYFLYADDAEYSLRMVKSGFSIFWIPKSSVLERREGDRERLRLFGIDAQIYKDEAKIYYAFRNQTYLYLRCRMRLPLIKTLLYALKVFFLILLLSKEPFKKMKAIIQGIQDGFKGKLGRNQCYLPK